MADIYVGRMRKDGKYPARYVYSNGVQLRKIRTYDQLVMDNAKYTIHGIWIDPMEWPETITPEDIEEYHPN